MSKRVALVMNVLALSTIASVAAMPEAAVAQSQDAVQQTEDVIYLEDGRMLTGKVISETNTEVVFEIINRELNIRSKMTFDAKEVTRIRRDVPVENPTNTVDTTRAIQTTDNEDADPWAGTFGTRQGESTDESLPSFYFVPMQGQMGTDIHQQVYLEMVDDIRDHDPDYLVFVMNTRAEREEILVPEHDFDGMEDPNLNGLDFIDMYRDIVNLFRDEMPNIKQVMWVEDADGIGTIMALAWDDLYMKPNASFGGAGALSSFWRGLQTNVDGKYREGMMALLKGFALYGGHSTDLVEGMVRAERTLHASWKGREVIWALNGNGDYVVDGSKQRTANFTAKTAEDFLISNGTAETLDDLALLLGEREYRIADGASEEIFDDYVTSWRRMYQGVLDMASELNQIPRMRYTPLQQASKMKSIYEDILKALDRYEAIEVRLATDFGINRLFLVTQIEILKEQIRAMRQQGRGVGGGTGGGNGPSGVGGG